MNIENLLHFVSNPRVYVNEVVQNRIKEYKASLEKRDFLVPIEATKPEDIFIVGYPKSGNTWMQSLVSGLLYGIDSQYLPDRLAQEIVPDVHAREFYKRFGDPTFFKSHHLPKPEYRRVIYLVRDGRDVMVSYYAMNAALGQKVTLDEMLVDGKSIMPCKWHQHVHTWQKNPYEAEIVVVKYEDLLQEPLIELRRICEFARIERDEESLQRVVTGNSIESMRDKANKYNGMGHHNWTGEKAQKFFRKGKVGSYREEMSKDLQEYFVQEAVNELKLMHYV